MGMKIELNREDIVKFVVYPRQKKLNQLKVNGLQ